MQNIRRQLTVLGERVFWRGEHIPVYKQGKPFFVMVPPDWYAAVTGENQGPDNH